MISVRFDLVYYAGDPRRDGTLTTRTLPCVPERGELVNIRGNPYWVLERSWAVDDDGGLHCFVRVKG